MEKAKKMKCYKRLIFKQSVQFSGLCSPQFLSYLPKRFTDLCRALYMETPHWCTVLVHQYGRRKSTKTSGVQFFYKSSFFSLQELLAYVHIKISSNTRNGYITENHEEILVFYKTTFLFRYQALWKLGSSNCCIFEMKHAAGMKTCTKIFLSILNLA